MLGVAQILAFISRPSAITANILGIFDLVLDLAKIFLFRERTDMQWMTANTNLIRHCPSLHRCFF
jgi:hypothetical protein